MSGFGDTGGTSGIAEQDVALYRAVLRSPGITLAAVAAALADAARVSEPGETGTAPASDADPAPADLDKSLARLSDIGLLSVGADGESITAVSPMLAEAIVLGAEELELGARRAAVEQRRNAIRRLVPEWNDVFTPTVNDPSVHVISDQSEVANMLMYYAANCESELLSVAPGRLPSTRMDGRTRVANVYSARRGIKTRALYQHVAMRDRATRAYLNELADNGARIRFAASVPGRSLVVDRSVALLPIPTEDPGRHGLAVIREPNLVAWVVATFEQLWAEATPLEDIVDKPQEIGDDTELDETGAAILRLMAEGEKDEAISRRLSISVRTCRRHIADYMSQVGATSRFQAGVIAARTGHLDAPSPE